MKLIHCSYHKCLTGYFQKVLSEYFLGKKELSGYIHFKSDLERFYNESDNYRISSINNHGLAFDRLPKDFRITRFIRDPRDLIVSGYYYHKRGAEEWCNIQSPKEGDWLGVNGCIPSELECGISFSEMLTNLDQQDGLLAQIKFRKKHLESMRAWPKDDRRIRLYKYEDVLGNEVEVFKNILEFYEIEKEEVDKILTIVDRNAASKILGRTKHVRDPVPGQWKEIFTKKIESYFNEHYSDILHQYNYI